MQAARARVAVSFAVLLAFCGDAAALNPALDINQYAHTSWTIREGFFTSPVLSLAQTPDGYLWVGTESGLFQFDGVRTVRWQPGGSEQLPSTTILKLLVTIDGRLWIGTSAGLASWKDGRLVTYPEFADHVVDALTEDSQGTVWAGSIAIPTARLCAIRSTIQCDRDGRLGNGVFSLLDDGGTLWVGATTGLWRWTPGNPTRYALAAEVIVSDLIKVNNGPLLLATSDGIAQVVGETVDPYRLTGIDRPFNAKRLLLDRDGGLWIGTSQAGLIHLHQGRVDVFTPSHGLSGDAISAVYEDREGNVWVGTNEGLDRFRELAVTRISRAQGLPTDLGVSVLPTRDGSVWVGSGDGVTRWRDGRATIYRTRDGLPDNRVGTLFEDGTGRILLSTLSGMMAFDNGQFTPLRSLASTRIVYNIVEGRAGDFWMTEQQQGLLHLVGEDVVERIPWSRFGRDDHATALAADPTQDGLWLGFYKGGVAFWKDGTIHASYTTADGLGAGRVAELRFDQDGALWAATAGGLSRIKDNRITTLTTGNGLPCEAVHWTIADADRSRWLLMPCGLAHISSAELAEWIADPARSVTSTVFDSSDGVRSQSTPIGFTPTVSRLPDGRLWFATPGGVGVLDPRRLPVNTLPPAVHIEQIVADRKPYGTDLNAAGRVQLPPRVHDLQIDYTALSLVAPEKVRFRYQLEGVDRDWQDVGNRRQAFYTDLPPRQYRFRVAAANNSGVWNEAGATVDFAIAPAYYQSTWFAALSVAAIVAVVWGAHRVRLRIVEKHQREISALNERLMKAQEQERIRIAGELHDGVMQEMLAVTMMLGTAKRRIPDGSNATATIDKIQDKMIKVGTDIRRLSHDLHPPILQEAGLPSAVQAHCEQFSTSCGIPISCEADENARDLSRGAALALFRIVQEALGNAAKHAAAKRITVRLTRSKYAICLTVSDDGVGFDRNQLASGGGLGLIMMRERTSQLNGEFEFDSAPGRGTTIRVVIPFR
jgi:signal transduction histidine kinase/ligand-binding sensor domain-containing protein